MQLKVAFFLDFQQVAAAPTFESVCFVMANKRTTNNSTIVNLEDQSAVISDMLEQAGVTTPKLGASSGEISKKIPKKKTKKDGQTTSKSQSATLIDSRRAADVTELATPSTGVRATLPPTVGAGEARARRAT